MDTNFSYSPSFATDPLLLLDKPIIVIKTLFNTCNTIAILKKGVIAEIYDKTEFHQLSDFKF